MCLARDELTVLESLTLSVTTELADSVEWAVELGLVLCAYSTNFHSSANDRL